MSEWGRNILVICCLNNLALSRSDIIKLLSGFLIRTFGVLVLHIFFVAHQRLPRLPSFRERFIKKFLNDLALDLAKFFFRWFIR